jgi:hypothetical protein
MSRPWAAQLRPLGDHLVDSSSISVGPSSISLEPSRHPVEPSRHPVEPSRHPVEPSRFPVDPSRFPVEPSRHPVERARSTVLSGGAPLHGLPVSRGSIQPATDALDLAACDPEGTCAA